MHGKGAENPEGSLSRAGTGSDKGGVFPSPGCSGEKEKPAAVLDDAGALRDGHPGERAAVYHGRSPADRMCDGKLQGKTADRAAVGTAVQKAEKIRGWTENNRRKYFCHQEWETGRPQQHLPRNESALRRSGNLPGKSIPAQSPAPVCSHIL